MDIFDSNITIKEEAPEEYELILPYDTVSDQFDEVNEELDPIKQEVFATLEENPGIGEVLLADVNLDASSGTAKSSPRKKLGKSRSKKKRRLTKNYKTGRKKHEYKFTCFNCCQSFNSKPALLDHVSTHDTPTIRVRYPSECDSDDERIFFCDQCPWKFKNKHLLGLHFINVHSDLRRFRCKDCGKSYKLMAALNDHKRSVHIVERKHVCLKCDKRFKIIHHLKEHDTRVHQKPKERNISCKLCSKKFYNQLDLNVHEKRSHGKINGHAIIRKAVKKCK